VSYFLNKIAAQGIRFLDLHGENQKEGRAAISKVNRIFIVGEN